MASGMTSTKRFIVRMSLVTGSTLATIIGAQSLASLNRISLAQDELPPQNGVTANNPNAGQPTQAAPPSITILRHPGQTNSANTSGSTSQLNQSASGSNQTVLQPPNPVLVQPPAPVIVNAAPQQQQSQQSFSFRPITRSSR